jgi:hypothetical protein
MHRCDALQGVLKYGMILMGLYQALLVIYSRTSIEEDTAFSFSLST